MAWIRFSHERPLLQQINFSFIALRSAVGSESKPSRRELLVSGDQKLLVSLTPRDPTFACRLLQRNLRVHATFFRNFVNAPSDRQRAARILGRHRSQARSVSGAN